MVAVTWEVGSMVVLDNGRIALKVDLTHWHVTGYMAMCFDSFINQHKPERLYRESEIAHPPRYCGAGSNHISHVWYHRGGQKEYSCDGKTPGHVTITNDYRPPEGHQHMFKDGSSLCWGGDGCMAVTNP